MHYLKCATKQYRRKCPILKRYRVSEKAGSKNDEGNRYYVRKQFPAKLDQCRRALFQGVRKARRYNQGIVRDRLFIEEVEDTSNEGRDKPAHQPTILPSPARTANALG